MLGARAGGLVDHFAGQVQGGAHAGRAVIERARLRATQLLQVFGSRLDAGILAGGQQHRLRRHQAQGREILGAVVLHRGVDHAGNHHFVGGAQENRIAVGGCARHALRADRAAGAAHVFNHHGLAQALAQLFAQQARGQVQAAAGGVADNQRNATRGVVGGVGSRRGGHGRGGTKRNKRRTQRMQVRLHVFFLGVLRWTA
ncbi:hypothetical protein D3C71_1285200 [compost metagenome]